MNENKEIKRELGLSDFLSILLKWKKYLIINLLIVSMITTIISFLIPETFKSTSQIKLSGGQGVGLSGLLSGNSALSMGADLLGIGGGGNEDLLLGILYSRKLRATVVNKFELHKYYGNEKFELDKTLKDFNGDIGFDISTYGFIEISVVNENPQLAADIANEFVRLADSTNIALSIENAANNKKYLAQRYYANIEDITIAEEKLAQFQKNNNIYSIPEQVQSVMGAASALQTELLENEVIFNALKNNVSPSSAIYKTIQNKIKSIKNKLNGMDPDNSNPIMLNFKDMPDIQKKYFRLVREVKIQNAILEFIYPLYEQAKLEEQKNIPSLQIIDEAVPAQLKYRPKKAYIIIIVTFLVFVFLVLKVFYMQSVLNLVNVNNNFEKQFLAHSKKIKKRYGVE